MVQETVLIDIIGLCGVAIPLQRVFARARALPDVLKIFVFELDDAGRICTIVCAYAVIYLTAHIIQALLG